MSHYVFFNKKNYLKLLNYFNKDDIVIHPPLKNDFGDMSTDQFPKWKSYLDDEEYIFDQSSYQKEILELIEQKEIPSSSYKNKFFNE